VDKLQRMERIVNWIEESLALLLMAVIVVAVFLQVFFRYVLQDPLSWTEELARSSLIWLTFVGSALAIRAKGHFVLEVLTSRLTGRTQIFWEVLLLGIVGAFLAVLISTGIGMLPMLSHQVSASLQIPMSYIYLGIPVGSSFMLFHVSLILWKKIGEFPCTPLEDQSSE